jgi:hypothetical protein
MGQSHCPFSCPLLQDDFRRWPVDEAAQEELRARKARALAGGGGGAALPFEGSTETSSQYVSWPLGDRHTMTGDGRGGTTQLQVSGAQTEAPLPALCR